MDVVVGNLGAGKASKAGRGRSQTGTGARGRGKATPAGDRNGSQVSPAVVGGAKKTTGRPRRSGRNAYGNLFSERAPVEDKKAADKKSDDKTVNPTGFFTRDLQIMMYGFGDSEVPLPETVDLVEKILVDYVTEVTNKAQAAAMVSQKVDPSSSKKSSLDEEDVLFVLRKDPKKFARAKELIYMQKVIRDARKLVDDANPTAVAEDGEAAADAGLDEL